jgi:hypothetical protein
MPWRDTLIKLREQLAHERAARRRQAAEDAVELRNIREELSRMSDSLEISGLLYEMNATLLDGNGNIETVVSWDSASEETGDAADASEVRSEEPLEEENIITTVLSWEEDGEREIAIEVVSAEQGPSLLVNGVDIRPDRDALEQALVEAFRDELEV